MKKVLGNKIVLCAIVVVVVLVAGLSFFFYNKGRISNDQLNAVSIGMSVAEIEKELGKPKLSTDDNKKISENSYDEYKTFAKLNALAENSDLQNRMEQLNTVYSASESDRNVKEYIYKVKNGSETRDVEIYFIGGVVEYINKVTE